MKKFEHYFPFIITFSYLLIVQFLGELKSSHFAILFITLLLGFWNQKTQSFLKQLWPFLLTAILYDSMRFYLFNLRLGIHIEDLYLLEKKIFGISYKGLVLTPNEFLNYFTNPFLDIITGISYVTFTLEYVTISLFLYFFGERKIANSMAYGYLIVNVMGFITYHLFPAAPPWYVLKHGFIINLNAPPDPAGAIRFDHFFNVNIFKNMYSMSANVFGAMPSLHVSYPFLGFLFTLKIKRWRIFQGLFSALMCFSAIYLYHHYLLDVLLGLTYAGITFIIVTKYPIAMKRIIPKKSDEN